MSARQRMVVGLFAEGSRATDPFLDAFGEIWRRITAHCGHSADVRVFAFDKGHIVRLRPETIPIRAAATRLARKAGRTHPLPGGEPLDVLLARTIAGERLERVLLAFDRFPSNQQLTEDERRRPCQMRAEVAFVLGHLSASPRLPERFRASASRLQRRYASDGELLPRDRANECMEIVFMDPMFEAILVSDETTVRKALGFDSRPKDWPKFKTRERALDKLVLDPAVECSEHRSGAYLAAKAKWGLQFLKAASDRAALWEHPIARRVCRILAA